MNLTERHGSTQRVHNKTSTQFILMEFMLGGFEMNLIKARIFKIQYQKIGNRRYSINLAGLAEFEIKRNSYTITIILFVIVQLIKTYAPRLSVCVRFHIHIFSIRVYTI